jgi:hypothetical protein
MESNIILGKLKRIFKGYQCRDLLVTEYTSIGASPRLVASDTKVLFRVTADISSSMIAI